MKLDKKSPAILDVSRRVYETSLVFYPKALRGEFGNEMVEVFDEQASEAYSESGVSGLGRVWCTAAREIATVAFPGRLVGRAIPIAAATATLGFMWWFASYISNVMETACSGCRIH